MSFLCREQMSKTLLTGAPSLHTEEFSSLAALTCSALPTLQWEQESLDAPALRTEQP